MSNKLAYTAGHFELTLDGHKTSAYLKSVEGGFMSHSLVDEAVGSELKRIRHAAVADIEPIAIELGMSGAAGVLQWIQDSWNKKFRPQSGQINHANFNMQKVFEHEFSEALITETTFPALDGGSKDPAYLKVKFQPTSVKTRKSGGPRLKPLGGIKQKAWLCSSFRFQIFGVKDSEYVNKVESFTIKQNVKKLLTGIHREMEIIPTKIEFPNLSVTIALEKADGILGWYEDYISKGKKDPVAQKNGAIEFLSPDRKTVLFKLSLEQIGILKASLAQSTANADQIKRVKFDLYVSDMKLEGLAGAGFD